jgi:hypothetical protein
VTAVDVVVDPEVLCGETGTACSCVFSTFLDTSCFSSYLSAFEHRPLSLMSTLSVMYEDDRPSLPLVARHYHNTVAEHALNLRQPAGSYTQPPT